MPVKFTGKLGDWVEVPEIIAQVLGKKAQQVALSITYQNKDGTQCIYELKHRSYKEMKNG